MLEGFWWTLAIAFITESEENLLSYEVKLYTEASKLTYYRKTNCTGGKV